MKNRKNHSPEFKAKLTRSPNVILGELLWKLQVTQMIAQYGLRMLAAVCLNVRFLRRAAAPDFTLLQHFARSERTQHEFATSAVGSDLPFSAGRSKVSYGPKVPKVTPLLHSAAQRSHRCSAGLWRYANAPPVLRANARLRLCLPTW